VTNWVDTFGADHARTANCLAPWAAQQTMTAIKRNHSSNNRATQSASDEDEEATILPSLPYTHCESGRLGFENDTLYLGFEFWTLPTMLLLLSASSRQLLNHQASIRTFCTKSFEAVKGFSQLDEESKAQAERDNCQSI